LHGIAQESLLIEFPEGSEIQNKYQELPLHRAAERGHMLSTIQLLLHVFPEGSKVEDTNGRLLLHCACDFHHKDIIGKLPIDIAFKKGNCATLLSLLIKDKKKYDEEQKKYQDKLEQERQQIKKSFETEAASLKQQVDHMKKHNRLLQEARRLEAKLLQFETEVTSLKQQVDLSKKRNKEARRLEAKLLSKLKNGDDWKVQDLKSILQSLNARLNAKKTQFQPGSQHS
jgi:hypothetical protein